MVGVNSWNIYERMGVSGRGGGAEKIVGFCRRDLPCLTIAGKPLRHDSETSTSTGARFIKLQMWSSASPITNKVIVCAWG